MSNDKIIPFGKYKGQPLEALHGDPKYCEWLISQAGIKERYPAIYTLIINYFSEQKETPEHNRFQALFLKDDVCLELLKKSGWGIFDHDYILSKIDNEIERRRNQTNSLFSYSAESDIKDLQQLKKDYVGVDLDNALEIKRAFECFGWDVCITGCVKDHILSDLELIRESDTIKLYVEIKPSIGDDFPAVLRQVKANKKFVSHSLAKNEFIIVYDRFSATSVTQEDMHQMFIASGFKIVTFSMIMK